MTTQAIPIPDPTTDKPPRPRRWIPLSLRIFVAILVLLGAESAYRFGMPIYRQHAAIRAIDRVEGVCRTRDGGPTWLRRWIGNERMRIFDELDVVNLDGTSVTDGDLAKLDGLPGLLSLNLGNTQVTDAGLVYVQNLTALTELSLARTKITDAGLVHLAGLRELRILSLDRTRISDDGLVHLKDLSDLQDVSFTGTRVTEAGLRRTLPEWFDAQAIEERGVGHWQSHRYRRY
jgi:Leucine-rich repeat (LRR) protein